MRGAMSEDRTNFTMIPHLIDDLGLDVYQYRIYCAIKRAAGETGVCTKSIKTLAKETGISRRKVQYTIDQLLITNPIVHKSLIKIKKRSTEHGDSDTNIITVVDVWTDNSHFKKQNGGGACGAPPGAQDAGGVVHVVHQGGACGAPKEEPILRKTNIKKTTTTSSSDVRSSSSFSDEIKRTAEAIKAWMDTQAMLPRKRKIGRHYDEVVWGKTWIFPLQVYLSLIKKYGFEYFQEHLQYMFQKQIQFDKGMRKNSIDIPETYLKKACKENYAEVPEKGNNN